MPRTINAAIRAGIEASQDNDPLLAFLTITHAGLETPFRVVGDNATLNGNPVTYSYNGAIFTALPFDLEILSDDDSAPVGKVSITNVDQVIGETVRAMQDRPFIALSILPASDFDLTVEPRVLIASAHLVYDASGLTIRNIKGDSLTMVGDLRSIDDTAEPWPGILATQARFPALFR